MGLYTKIDVVNTALAVTAQLPINDLETPHPAVPAIVNAIDNATRELQVRPRWFNTDNVTLKRQTNGRILVPNDVLNIAPRVNGVNLAIRGRYVYDVQNSTYEFDADLECTVQRMLPFEELPPLAAECAKRRAVLDYQSGIDADSARSRDLQNEYRIARAELEAEHTRKVRANLLRRNGVLTWLHRIAGDSADDRRVW